MTRSHALTSLCSLALLLFAPACNDDGPTNDEVGETGDEGSSSDDETSETDDEASTDDASTTDDTSTTNDSSTTETTDDTTDDAETTDDTTDSTTGDPDNSTYSAVAFPGGLDRVVITRVDPDGPSCSRMVLVLPGFDQWSVDLPPMWGVESVQSWDQLECDLEVEPDAWGEGGVGAIEFLGTDAFDLYPCALSIDVEVDMDTDPPSSMIWFTEFVVVEGVNCG